MPMSPAKRLSEALADYLARSEKRGRATLTVQIDSRILRRFISDVGDLEVTEVTKDHVGDWFYGKGGMMDHHQGHGNGQGLMPPIGASTHNQYRQRLSTFFRFCATKGWIREDLMAEVEPMKITRKKRQQPSPDILLRLLDAAGSPRDRAYIATAMNTALRQNEIIRIRMADLDLDQGFIDVTISKTNEEDRQPISSDLDTELRKWLVQYESDLGRPLEDDDHLFPLSAGGLISHFEVDEKTGHKTMVRHPYHWVPERPVVKSHLLVQKAMKEVGLTTKYEGTHTIRRAVARAFFDSLTTTTGYDAALRTVSALLHHSSTATTERYLGLTSERQRRDDVLKGQPFLTAMVNRDNVIPIRRVQ
jgi:integrase